MNLLEFWQYKVLQTFHDPVGKNWLTGSGMLGHKELALKQLKVITGEKQSKPFFAPDWLATGADRPVVGNDNTCKVNWREFPIITHPLQPETRMHVEWEDIHFGEGSKIEANILDEKICSALEKFALSNSQWKDDTHSVRRLFLHLWRQFPEIIRELGLQEPFLPADSRIPDHSIWDHNRVASAAAFLVEYDRKNRPPEREPWMLAITLGGVQRFISETRTTRDLWTASMIYSDLAWAAMRPIVEKLGPDAVLYPDLRGNPTVDRWLLEKNQCPEAVPKSVRETEATSFAAMLPNTFLVLAPRGGGDSGLPELQHIAEECTKSVQNRWRELGDAVEGWFVKRKQPGSGKWQDIWRRQMEGRYGEPPVTWTAIPWLRQMYDIGNAVRGAAIPGQSPNAASPELPEQLMERERKLAPWLPHRIWRHYEMARDVFWHTDTEAGTHYISNERGFDYPLAHHQLRTVLAMCKAQGAARVAEEPGEKCSISGREQALTNGPKGNGPLVTRQREGARSFWAGLDVEGTGMERLGSTAAIKRYLVQSGEPKFTATWEPGDERNDRREKTPKVPFPSLAAIAAAEFIEELSKKSKNQELSEAIRNYVRAFEETSLENTVDPRVLPAFIRASKVPVMKDFLTIEPEYIFPETLEILIRRENDSRKKESLKKFQEASVHLRQTATKAKLPAPRKFVSVLRMDGDNISKLILGDPEVVKTRWKDVLHPEAIKQVQEKLAGTGWPGLLGEKRHSGPAFHTAITHSLSDFAHKIVAWVVEREFGGRLIYAGGDDLLAILPAVEAVPAAARLQQLYSAPYILDTQSDADHWSWRRSQSNDVSNPEEARQRFRVPIRSESGDIRLSERKFEEHANGTPTLEELTEGMSMALYTMLGRQNSLSAGIAIGHYKEPLRLLLNTAGEMLENVAKETMGRSSVAVALLSSGGRKATFAARWREESSSTDTKSPYIQQHLMRVIEAFQSRQDSSASDRQNSPSLPKRLPYALREQIERMGRVLLDYDEQDQNTSENQSIKKMIDHLIEKESGISKDKHKLLIEAMRRLIECGIEYVLKLEKRNRIADGNLENPISDSERIYPVEFSDQIIAGFLLTRKLSSDGGDDGIS